MRAIPGLFEKFSRKLPLAQLRVLGLIREKGKSPKGFAAISLGDAAVSLGLEEDAVSRSLVWLKAFRVIEERPKRPGRYRVNVSALERLQEPKRTEKWPDEWVKGENAEFPFLKDFPRSAPAPSKIRKELHLKRSIASRAASLQALEALLGELIELKKSVGQKALDKLDAKIASVTEVITLMRPYDLEQPGIEMQVVMDMEAKKRKVG